MVSWIDLWMNLAYWIWVCLLKLRVSSAKVAKAGNSNFSLGAVISNLSLAEWGTLLGSSNSRSSALLGSREAVTAALFRLCFCCCILVSSLRYCLLSFPKRGAIGGESDSEWNSMLFIAACVGVCFLGSPLLLPVVVEESNLSLLLLVELLVVVLSFMFVYDIVVEEVAVVVGSACSIA